MLPDELPETTSATQLATYAACPRRYQYRYVERREPEARAAGLVLGSAVHSVLAWYFDERVAERDPDRGNVHRVLGADLAAAMAADPVRWGGSTPETLAGEARLLVNHFLDEHGDLAVSETEVRFDLLIVDPETGERMPRPLVGYNDAELASGNLLELKVVRSAYSPVALRANVQLAAYRTVARYYGVDVELMAIVRTKRPRIQHAVLPHDGGVSRWFMSTAASIERAILARHFPPTPGSSCAGCEYRQACLGHDEEVTGARTARDSAGQST